METTKTLAATMNGKSTATIGHVIGNGCRIPFVLRHSAKTGSVIGCLREGKKMIPITGRFADDRALSSLLEYTNTEILENGCRVEVA